MFVRDRRAGITFQASVSSDGENGNSGSDLPAISRYGRHVAFTSNASNLVEGADGGVFVRLLAP